MTKTSTSTRKVYYRRTEFTPEQERNLQQMLSTALSQHSVALDRAEAIGSKASEFRVISQHKTVGAFLCGQLTTFDRGSYQTVIKDDPKAKTLSLNAVSPPKIDDVQSQFVPGVLYFALFKNHIVLIQNTTVKTSTFEQHLAWLLRTKCNILNSTDGFFLKDEPPPATKDRIKKSHVKNICVNRSLMIESSTQKDNNKSKTARLKTDNTFINLLKDFCSDSLQFEKLGLENNLYADNLDVLIEIRFPKRQRSKAEDSIKLLDDLGILLRDHDEDEVKLELSDGSVVKGKNLIISSSIEINLNEKGLPNENEIFSEMCDWLNTQIKNGIIAP